MSLKTCSLHVYFLFLSANARREKNGNNLVVLVQLQSKNLKTIVIHFQKYLPSFMQSAVFTGRAARQSNRLYVLRMIVK